MCRTFGGLRHVSWRGAALAPGDQSPSLRLGAVKLPEPFLSDDKLAAMGIDVESMDKFHGLVSSV